MGHTVRIRRKFLDMGAAFRQLAFDELHCVEPGPVPDPRPNIPDRLFTRDAPSRPVNPGPRTDNQLQRRNIPRFERP